MKRATTLAIVVALVLAACSSSSKNSAARQQTPTPTAVTPTTVTPKCGDPVASIAPVGPRPAPNNMPAGTFMQRIQTRGHLVAGVSADTLLFGFRDPFTGNLEGFDIDVIHQIATAIFGDPNKVDFRVLTYAQRIPALQSGQVDIVADVMTINCTRWTQISFSSQYFEAGQKVLVRSDSKAAGIGELNGKRVCVTNGSTNFDEMKKYPKVIPVPVDDVSDCMVKFQQGDVDAVTADDTVLEGFAKQDPYARIVGDAFTSEPYGLGIAKTHPEFVQFVNSVLDDMRQNGTWKQLYANDLKPSGPIPNPPPAKYGRTP